MKSLEHYIKSTQTQIFKELYSQYAGCYCHDKAYVLVPGNAPVMLVAHLDTVHKEQVKIICKSEHGRILMSPQGIGGDDRCGVYALNAIYAMAKVKPWLLFTCDEEIGGVGADIFASDFVKGNLPEGLKDLKLLIEIDRKGHNDAVFYDCDNPAFEAYINSKGFVTDWGSFSDISIIAPELGVAAVNLSSGYYNAHTLYEYIDFGHLEDTINRVLEIVEESPKLPQYQYIEAKTSFWSTRYYSSKDLPKDVEDEYIELLDFYSEEELEEIRNDLGDNGIHQLFQYEFGGTQYEDYKRNNLKRF